MNSEPQVATIIGKFGAALEAQVSLEVKTQHSDFLGHHFDSYDCFGNQN
jgi:hypothetical protein